MGKSNLYKDWQYRLAIIAALPVWAAFYWMYAPIVDPAWVLAAPLLFLNLVLLQPVLEELVFRGFLQDWLMKQAWASGQTLGVSVANVMTSLLFTSLHFIHHAPLMAAIVFIPSLILGYFRDRYHGWLIPSIGLHCFYNVGNFLMFGID